MGRMRSEMTNNWFVVAGIVTSIVGLIGAILFITLFQPIELESEAKQAQITERMKMMADEMEALSDLVKRLEVSGAGEVMAAEKLIEFDRRLGDIEDAVQPLKTRSPLASSEYVLLAMEINRFSEDLSFGIKDVEEDLRSSQEAYQYNLDTTLDLYFNVLGGFMGIMFFIFSIAFVVLYRSRIVRPPAGTTNIETARANKRDDDL